MTPKQAAFPGLRDAMKKRQKRRETLVGEMEAVLPWTRPRALVEPYCPTAWPKGGRPPMPLDFFCVVEADQRHTTQTGSSGGTALRDARRHQPATMLHLLTAPLTMSCPNGRFP